MVNSGIKRLDSPLDHIDRTVRAKFAPLPKPRTYSFDLSTYRESVRRLGSAPVPPVKPGSLKLPSVKPTPTSKPMSAPNWQATKTPVPAMPLQAPDLDIHAPTGIQPPLSSPPQYHHSVQKSAEHVRAHAPSAVEAIDLSALPQFHPSQSDLHPTLPVPLTAMNLLRDIEAAIIGWQSALHRVLGEIQCLYDAGPMIDGWLESVSSDPSQRNIKRLRFDPEDHARWNYHQGQVGYTPEPTYYVCGYTEAGELWSRPCPTEQVANISLAISRYQKLQEFLRHKQTIEHYLAELAKTILEFHGQVRRIGRRQNR